MSDKQYMDADWEVISMVNKGRGKGGELPGKAVHFIPEKNAERVLALDNRLQQAQKAMPYIMAGVSALMGLVIGLAI